MNLKGKIQQYSVHKRLISALKIHIDFIVKEWKKILQENGNENKQG